MQTCRAVIADMDGVVTETAVVHAEAWKGVFDEVLKQRYPDQPLFDRASDYTSYVDGKPRYEGVRSFLAARDIELPEGGDEDGLSDATISGVGNAKNRRFLELLERGGAEAFEDAVATLERWRASGVPLAVVSSSRNCEAVLRAAGMLELFDARADGLDVEQRALAGKPEPDAFLLACERLGADASETMVLEDAVAGVRAGRRGGFAVVVGVGRSRGRRDVLTEAGADFVVSSLDEVEDLVRLDGQ